MTKIQTIPILAHLKETLSNEIYKVGILKSPLTYQPELLWPTVGLSVCGIVTY